MKPTKCGKLYLIRKWNKYEFENINGWIIFSLLRPMVWTSPGGSSVNTLVNCFWRMLAFSKSRYSIEFLLFESSRRELTPVLTFSFFLIKDKNSLGDVCDFSAISLPYLTFDLRISSFIWFLILAYFFPSQHQVVLVSTFCTSVLSILVYSSNLYSKELQMKFSKHLN